MMRKVVKNKKLTKFIIISISLIITVLVGLFIIKESVDLLGKRYIIYDKKNIKEDINNIIVLGAGVKTDGTPSDILMDRLITALEIEDKNNEKRFLLSGDHGREGYNEVKAMKNMLVEDGVNEEKIFLDHAGFSTYESIYRAKEIFKVEKAIIITNEYHLPRALYLARKMGIEAYGIPSDIRKYDNIDLYEKRENLAKIKDFIYVNILKPEPTFLGDEIPIETSNGLDTDDEI